ncbi:hypothetical protein Trydic_g6557, partial [Trypoxylus dichotomus]
RCWRRRLQWRLWQSIGYQWKTNRDSFLGQCLRERDTGCLYKNLLLH